MAARGVLIGLNAKLRDELLAKSETDRVHFLEVTIWERPSFDDARYTLLLDKSWDALHRCLGEFPPETPYFYDDAWSDGGRWARPEDHGSYPLRWAILGGQRLFSKDNSYLIRLIERPEVSDLAEALDKIDQPDLTRRYWYHCRGAWQEYGQDDLDYTWHYFQEMRTFYKGMAEERRCVVFLADQ